MTEPMTEVEELRRVNEALRAEITEVRSAYLKLAKETVQGCAKIAELVS